MRKGIPILYGLSFLALALCGLLAFAQEEQPGPASGRRQIPTVINLSGTVMQEDGSAPPGMVRVEMVCDGTVREQALLDSSGNFNLQFGSGARSRWEDASAAIVMDPTYVEIIRDEEAEDPGMADMRNTNLGQMNLSGCEIRAQPIVGFRSDPIPLGPRSVFDNPDVGVIILQRTHRDTAATTNVVALAAPPEAVQSYEKARRELTKKESNVSRAREELEKAVEIYPKFAQAWYLLGNAQLRLGDQAGARESFDKAISEDEGYIAAYVQLADLEVKAENFEEAAELTRQVKELDPSLPEIRYLDGLSNYFLNRTEVAKESLDFLVDGGYGERYPIAYCYLGMIESKSGNLDTASQRVRECLDLAPETLLPEDDRAALTRQIEIWEDGPEVAAPLEAEPGLIWVGERSLGIEFQDHPGGVLIRNVDVAGSAWVAGLRPGDIVVSINGGSSDFGAFGQLFREIAQGTTREGTFKVWRNGGEILFRTQRSQTR